VAAVLARVLAAPGHAPELLALAAVEHLGPRADAWAAAARESYPAAGPAALARLAARDVRVPAAAGGVLAALSGLLAPPVALGAGLVAKATTVLRVAAAHGLDATDPDRAADLLLLVGLYQTWQEARDALDAADRGGTAGERPFDALARRFGGPVAAQVAGWLALRTANRVLPGAAVVLAALTGRAAVDGVAGRALTYYGRGDQGVRAVTAS
jgi:hypothetical protein